MWFEAHWLLLVFVWGGDVATELLVDFFCVFAVTPCANKADDTPSMENNTTDKVKVFMILS